MIWIMASTDRKLRRRATDYGVKPEIVSEPRAVSDPKVDHDHMGTGTWRLSKELLGRRRTDPILDHIQELGGYELELTQEHEGSEEISPYDSS